VGVKGLGENEVGKKEMGKMIAHGVLVHPAQAQEVPKGAKNIEHER